MIDELEIENFLSHHGVKGQKWGIRNSKLGGGLKEAFKKAPPGDWETRSKAQKAALLTTGFFGAVVTTPVDKLFSRVKNVPLRIALGVSSSVVTSKLAVRFVRNVLQTNGKKKVKNISVADSSTSGKKVSSKQANKAVQDFIKKNPTGRDESYFKKSSGSVGGRKPKFINRPFVKKVLNSQFIIS